IGQDLDRPIAPRLAQAVNGGRFLLARGEEPSGWRGKRGEVFDARLEKRSVFRLPRSLEEIAGDEHQIRCELQGCITNGPFTLPRAVEIDVGEQEGAHGMRNDPRARNEDVPWDQSARL